MLTPKVNIDGHTASERILLAEIGAVYIKLAALERRKEKAVEDLMGMVGYVRDECPECEGTGEHNMLAPGEYGCEYEEKDPVGANRLKESWNVAVQLYEIVRRLEGEVIEEPVLAAEKDKQPVKDAASTVEK